MGDRRSEVIADVAWGARGVKISCNGLNVYSGPAWPGMAQLNDWGLPWMVGYEGAVDRAFGGAPAAEQDMMQLINRMRNECPDYITLGCGFWWCAHDGNGTPDWALGNITAYGRRMHEIAVDNGWNPKSEEVYGNRAASSAGVAGSRAAGGNGQMWGVGTWNFGEGGGAYMLPASSDAWILQSGNTPGPVPGDTDYNAVYADLVEFGYYGLTAAPVAPTKRKRSKMYIVLNLKQGWFVINEDGSLGSKFIGPSTNGFGVPDEVVSKWSDVPSKLMSDEDFALAKALQGKG